ncbi:hypothetical protein BpHYR1_020021 [Brachionus plicatilis]|uniref:Uncharacterized protein n=1 Tax=Brachionus plicatilis TaxID=10195 RepID=A0A3M7SBC6_BRAPC|nr:hypothetical protein BpHYR1_020021 [Brachionus plicatilis]
MIQMNLNQKICKDLLTTLFYRLRQLCSLGIDKPKLKLGGEGQIVEIDESFYAKARTKKEPKYEYLGRLNEVMIMGQFYSRTVGPLITRSAN